MSKTPTPDDRNPLTGQPPNSYTKSTNRELPRPTNVKPKAFDAKEGASLRKLHREAVAPGGSADAPLGYRRPEGMADEHFSWLMGGHRMMPNTAAARGTSAINVPHAAHPEVTVQRRAEDLSKGEYEHGAATLKHFGHDTRDPLKSLDRTHSVALDRVMAEHTQAGVNESSSQLFYGGRPTTRIPGHLQKTHNEGVMAAYGRLEQAHASVLNHPQFQAATAHLPSDHAASVARAAVNQSVADTSPNSKWRQGSRWPNIEQAEESTVAAVEGRDPKFIAGRIQNVDKAHGRAKDALASADPSTHHFGNPKEAAKTVAFRGALADKDAADAYKVSDIHEASVIAPGLPTGKSLRYTSSDGKAFSHYPDQPKSALKGAAPIVKEGKTSGRAGNQETGFSRPEQMLGEGKSYVHALNDRATRQVASRYGISRSVDHADNVHTIQAAAWGSQQMRRADVHVSHADQYPVVRDWGSEGQRSLAPEWQAHFGENARMHMGEQFRENPNTKTNVNASKAKPYPIMPGE
ncbi:MULTISPECIES: hypothetical protein [Streptosporangium]|uniref:Uncharacterized protein n=1 Tax=Streptosporangium brasiliense TaxID=47480 RepID=A0ABT9RNJ7_9ACTN|nr:hypothetical protein [Streptosporangium brasiliense]MDP9870411.1 hypothetical protein [Streptosporangium brasiliense]